MPNRFSPWQFDDWLFYFYIDLYRCHCQPTLKIKGAALKLLDSYDINNSSNVNSKAVATIFDDLPQYHMIVSTRNWTFRFGIDLKPQFFKYDWESLSIFCFKHFVFFEGCVSFGRKFRYCCQVYLMLACKC